MQFWADFHTHTRFSHGKGSMADNVREAARKGLKTVGISDHGPASVWIGIQRGRLAAVLAERDRCRRLFPQVQVLLSMEANVVSTLGDIDVPPEWEPHLDYLLVGLHPRVIPKNWQMAVLFIGNFLYRNVPFLLPRQWKRKVRRANTKALSLAVERHKVLAVTHPGYGLPVDTIKLAAHCRARGTALEINNGHALETADFVAAAAETGVAFIVSSDAHQPGKVGNLERAGLLAEETGLEASRIVNAVSLNQDAGRHPAGAEIMPKGRIY